MADWVGYFGNAIAELYNAASSSITGVNDSGATGTAVYAVDGDLATPWAPGAGATKDFYINLGSAQAVEGIAVLGHNVSTLCTLYSSASYATASTSQVAFTPTSGVDTGALFGTPGTGVSSRYWLLRVVNPTASTYVGEIALFLSSGRVAFLDAGPFMPLARPLSPGFGLITTANGSVQTQVNGGVSQEMNLLFKGVKLQSGETWATLESLYRSSNGFRKGLWLLDDSFSTPGRIYYGLPLDGLPSVNDMPGGRVSGSLHVLFPPSGLSV